MDLSPIAKISDSPPGSQGVCVDLRAFVLSSLVLLAAVDDSAGLIFALGWFSPIPVAWPEIGSLHVEAYSMDPSPSVKMRISSPVFRAGLLLVY